jgi:hypothetical protein
MLERRGGLVAGVRLEAFEMRRLAPKPGVGAGAGAVMETRLDVAGARLCRGRVLAVSRDDAAGLAA